MSDDQYRQRLAALLEDRDHYKRLYEQTLQKLAAYEPPIIEPCRVPNPCTVPVKPGFRAARAAYRAGCEDAYEEHLRMKYGEGW